MYKILNFDESWAIVSLVTRLSPLAQLFKLVCKERESLVYFDHVLDVVGRGYWLAVDFAHAHLLLVLLWTRVRGRIWPINGNHIQHVIKIYQALPLLTCELK